MSVFCSGIMRTLGTQHAVPHSISNRKEIWPFHLRSIIEKSNVHFASLLAYSLVETELPLSLFALTELGTPHLPY